MRLKPRRIDLAQIARLSLIATMLTLWCGGSSWHALTCGHVHLGHDHSCHHDHAHSDSASEFITCDSKCDHTTTQFEPVSQHSDSHQHDAATCPICQWVAQVCLPVALVQTVVWNSLEYEATRFEGLEIRQVEWRPLSARGPPCLV